jgi:hypothetical protein
MTSDSASRATRSRRSLGLAITLLAGGIVAVGALEAQEAPGTAQSTPAAAAKEAPAPATPGTAAVPTATTRAPAPGPASVPAPAAGHTAAPAQASAQPPPADAKTPSASGKSGEHFEPTEKVRADYDVSFPVDI